ncbi:hypothetical protein LJC27_03710 [Christensenellaceae bacterium OttesenSCG-928-M15]|nr:hypothetical protein [Christensenellaceae bacterium OttesenSCG-928-M15]
MKKKLLPLLLVIALLLQAVPALAEQDAFEVASTSSEVSITAEDGTIGLRYTLILAISASIDIKGNTIGMSGVVSSQGASATYSRVTMTLQKLSGTKWVDVQTYYAYGIDSASCIESYSPAESGVFYRVKVVGYQSVGSTSESETIYSHSVTK